MTVSSTTRKAGPYTGTGLVTTYGFAFKVFATSDVRVTRTVSGVDADLVLTTDYTVNLNADQDNNPGGNVVLVAPLGSGYGLTISTKVSNTQPTDITNSGNFYPQTIEDALDRAAIQVQQLAQSLSGALQLPITAPAGVSTTLPLPSANKLIGWDAAAQALVNFDASTLATIVAYGTANRDFFTGDGTTKSFTLSSNPGALGNLDVDLNGVTQAGSIDFTWSGTTLTFTAAPANGVRVQARYFQGLPQGTTDSSASTWTQAGTGAVTRTVQDKLRERCTIRDFNATAGSGGDDTTAWVNALNSGALEIDGENLTYRISAGLSKVVGGGGRCRVRRAKFISVGVPDNTPFLTLSGTSATTTLSINAAAKGDTSLGLPSGTVAAGDWLMVRGTNLWNDTAVNTYPSVTMGEWVQVVSQVGTTVNLAAPLRYDYTTGPQIVVTPMADLIEVEDVTGVSDNTGFAHSVVSVQYAVRAVARGVVGSKCSYAGSTYGYCVNVFTEDCGNRDPGLGLGLAYGTVVAYATRSAVQIRPFGRGCRHVTAHGGYTGVIAECTVIDPVGDNQYEGVVDAHASVDQQTVIGGNAGGSASANSKLISSQARRLRVIGAQCEQVANAIVWNPACTAYPSALIVEGADVKATTSAVLVGIASTQPCELVRLSGRFEGGLGATSGDGVQITHSSNLTVTGATPGKIKRLEIRGQAFGYQRGVYALGSARAQTFGDIDIDAYCYAPNVAGSYPLYIVPTNQADSNTVRVRGVMDGGNTYTARFDNCNEVDADIYSMNVVTDAIFNNKSGDADALNRFNLRARIPTSGGANNQHRGTLVANGTTAVVVNTSMARAGSFIFYSLKTVGGTPGVPYTSAIVSGTSFSFKSSAGDTSTYNWWLENPATGP